MGTTSYCYTARETRAISSGYFSKPAEQIFTQRNINNVMSPYDVKIRESRDSKQHPNSLAIILGLDVTGSMMTIPHYLVKDGLPNIMKNIIDSGIPDPQILFMGIGDHECDQAPLQIGQFESGDELLDKWLTTVWLEGGGGGNWGESYLLAWYFAAYHTVIDCFEKRKTKGLLFTIGDEPPLRDVPARALKNIMGDGQYQNFKALELLEQVSKLYDVYHIHINHNGGRQSAIDEWKQILGDNLIITENREQVAKLIADKVIETRKHGQKTIKNNSQIEDIIL